MTNPEGNKWKVFGRFCKSWWGVASLIVTGLVAAVTTSIAVGAKVVDRLSVPGQHAARLVELEDMDEEYAAYHKRTGRSYDSIFAKLEASDAKIQLFFDLYRCTEAGYTAHDCPLLGDDLGIEPLAPAERRTLVPQVGPNQ